MIKVLKDFLTHKEISILNEWTDQNHDQNFFQDAEMDIYYPKTRFTTRIVNTNEESISAVVEYPEEAYQIQKRIQQYFNLNNILYPPTFRNGIVNGIGFQNGSICKHSDPMYYENTITVHCNFITQKPVAGGVTIIEDHEYDIEEGDMLMYAVSELNHEVTPIVGTKPRILWCYGFCLNLEKAKEIFK